MRRRNGIRTLIGAAAVALGLGAAGGAEQAAAGDLGPGGGAVSAEAAHRAAIAGEATLVDIRTPQEWAKTGTPQGAKRISLHAPDFGARLTALLNDPEAKPVALICATGRRSGYVMAQLRKMGLDGRAYNVSEGVSGSRAGPGWLRRGLPIDRTP